ncbi:PD40 domain-containing protein [Robertmurraya sp. DFI.2.37]|uniref:TolB family protein n=1 Tax=Robertmurraya sp. DFI.2.37 TaxID=3031819 RepID=UPI001248C1A8|nr:PD40 domain-containing protein [Robertmurraya sp. DFI.2.37]MDF1510493.1 PD40 domain-containing protein [Robertmurraya sp. DFI.2.37]
MKKMSFITVFILALSLTNLANAAHLKDMKAAFIRDGNLWILVNQQEKQITHSGKIYQPQWSHDGKWILYQKEANTENKNEKIHHEIWVYNIETEEKKKIFHNGYAPQWAPHNNWVAFIHNQILNISNLTEFHNLALGVSSFQWLPTGQGFLLASPAYLKPDGWTCPILYKKQLPNHLSEANVFGNVKEFFVVPQKLKIDNKYVMSNRVDFLSFSPSGKWLSLIISPTASLAMDSNMLCGLSSDGKSFEIVNEVVYEVGSPKWAPAKDILAYIGGGRIVFGFRGKDLLLKEFAVSSLTPANFAELNFTWVDDQLLITSRVEAKDWSDEFSEHPLPSLYSVTLNNEKQVKITEPANGLGDYDPHYLKAIDKLIWYRGTSINDHNRNLWIADTDGSNGKILLKNIDEIKFFES